MSTWVESKCGGTRDSTLIWEGESFLQFYKLKRLFLSQKHKRREDEKVIFFGVHLTWNVILAWPRIWTPRFLNFRGKRSLHGTTLVFNGDKISGFKCSFTFGNIHHRVVRKNYTFTKKLSGTVFYLKVQMIQNSIMSSLWNPDYIHHFKINSLLRWLWSEKHANLMSRMDAK